MSGCGKERIGVVGALACALALVLGLAGCAQGQGSTSSTQPQASAADKLPGMLDASCPEGTKLAYVHDRPEKSALGMYRYVIELERENGFSDEEISRLEGIDGLEYLGRYSRIEG